MTALRLRPGVAVCPVDGGLLVTEARGGGFLVAGPDALGTVWAALDAPLASGVAADELADLLAGLLPDGGREAAARLLHHLRARGAVVEAPAAGLAELGARHPGTLALLTGERPEEKLAAFCSRTVGVTGEPAGVRLLAEALNRLGAAHVVTRPGRGPVPGADLVVSADLTHRPAGGAPWLGVLFGGDRAYVGPVQQSSQDPGLAEVLARCGAGGDRPEPTDDTVARLAAAVAGLSALEHGAGLPPRHTAVAHLVHRDGLRVTRHRLDGGPAELTDPWLGLLTESPDGDLPQTPVPLGSAAVRRGGAVRHATGETPGQARDNALAAAARDLVPTRGLQTVAVGQDPEGVRRDAARRFAVQLWLGPARREVFDAPVRTADAHLYTARSGGRAFTVAAVPDEGRTLGLWADPDPDVAVAHARSHALMRQALPAGQGLAEELVPTVLADGRDWDGATIMELLTELSGVRATVAPWTGTPSWPSLAVLGVRP